MVIYNSIVNTEWEVTFSLKNNDLFPYNIFFCSSGHNNCHPTLGNFLFISIIYNYQLITVILSTMIEAIV